MKRITLKSVFLFNTVIGLLFGIPAVLVPQWVMSNYGAELIDPVGIFLTRFYGADEFGTALLTWLVRNEPRTHARQSIVLSRFVASSIRSFVAIFVAVSGVVNVLGWTIVALVVFCRTCRPLFRGMNTLRVRFLHTTPAHNGALSVVCIPTPNGC